MSIYVAESISADCRRFGHVGLLQLRTFAGYIHIHLSFYSCHRLVLMKCLLSLPHSSKETLALEGEGTSESKFASLNRSAT